MTGKPIQIFIVKSCLVHMKARTDNYNRWNVPKSVSILREFCLCSITGLAKRKHREAHLQDLIKALLHAKSNVFQPAKNGNNDVLWLQFLDTNGDKIEWSIISVYKKNKKYLDNLDFPQLLLQLLFTLEQKRLRLIFSPKI